MRGSFGLGSEIVCNLMLRETRAHGESEEGSESGGNGYGEGRGEEVRGRRSERRGFVRSEEKKRILERGLSA